MGPPNIGQAAGRRAGDHPTAAQRESLDTHARLLPATRSVPMTNREDREGWAAYLHLASGLTRALDVPTSATTSRVVRQDGVVTEDLTFDGETDPDVWLSLARQWESDGRYADALRA